MIPLVEQMEKIMAKITAIEVNERVQQLTSALLSHNENAHYALGYLESMLKDVISALPAKAKANMMNELQYSISRFEGK